MFKKVVAVTTIIALMAIGFGCASIARTDKFNGLDISAEGKDNVYHYNANCWGFYLLSIPLITGDPEDVSIMDKSKIQINMVLMKDTVNLDSVAEMLSRNAKDDGATILEDVSSVRSNILFWFPLPIFFFKSVTMTANAVK